MKKNKLNIAPLLLLILSNLLGLIIMMQRDETSNETVVLFSGICIISIVVTILLVKCDMGDPYLFLIATMLATIGIIVLLSINELMTTLPNLEKLERNFGIKNMQFYLFGVAIFFVTILVYRLFYKHLAKLTPLYFIAMIGLYVVTIAVNVLTSKPGEEAGNRGAMNWLFGIQPSEFIKILLVLTVAGILTFTRKKKEDVPEKKRYTSTFGEKFAQKTHINRRIMLITAVVYINIMFLGIQSELGTVLVMIMLLIAYLVVYDKNKLFLLANVALCTAVSVVFVVFIDSIPSTGVGKIDSMITKVEDRIMSWKTPDAEIPRYKGTEYAGTIYGYQVLRSIRNVRGGEFVGTGIENAGAADGVRVFDSLHSEFIFSAICNEMGIMGGVGVLLLFFVLVYRGFKIAVSTTNEFNKAVAFGISTMLGVQTFIIVAGVINLIPLTGITLPFVSYGGSSMIATFMMLGILQAISGVKGDTTDEIK